MKRIILFLFLSANIINAQFWIAGGDGTLTVIDQTPASLVLSATPYESSLLFINETSFSPIVVDSIIFDNDNVFITNVEELDDTNRFTDQNTIADWDSTNIDSLFANPDTTALVSAPSEGTFWLNQNLVTTVDQAYTLTQRIKEGEINIIPDSNGTFEQGTVGDWASYSGGTASISTDKIKIKSDNSGFSGGQLDEDAGFTKDMIKGDLYYLTFEAWKETGTLDNWRVALGASSPNQARGTITTTRQTFADTITALGADDKLFIYVSTGTDSFFVDNIRLYHLDDASQTVETATFDWIVGSQSGSTDTVTAIATDHIFTVWGEVENDYYFLDGTDDAITFSGISAFGTDSFSVSAVINIDAISGGQEIVGGATNSFGFKITGGGKLVATKINVSDVAATMDVLSTDIQIHVGYSRDDSNTGIFYVNGIAIDTVTDNQDYTIASTIIGSKSGGDFFGGNIHDIKIYNRELLASEFLILFNNKTNTNPTSVTDSLKGDWNGNDGNITDATWNDVSGNSNDGTVTGATANYLPQITLSLSNTAKVIWSISFEKNLSKFSLNYLDSLFVADSVDVDTPGNFSTIASSSHNVLESPVNTIIDYVVGTGVQDSLYTVTDVAWGDSTNKSFTDHASAVVLNWTAYNPDLFTNIKDYLIEITDPNMGVVHYTSLTNSTTITHMTPNVEYLAVVYTRNFQDSTSGLSNVDTTTFLPVLTTYYADDGDDLNAGTPALPKQTIQDIEATDWSPGDWIVGKSGSHFTNNSGNDQWLINETGKVDSLIIYGRYNLGAKPIFGDTNSTSVSKMVQFRSSHQMIYGWKILTNYLSAGASHVGINVNASASENLYIKNCYIDGESELPTANSSPIGINVISDGGSMNYMEIKQDSITGHGYGIQWMTKGDPYVGQIVNGLVDSNIIFDNWSDNNDADAIRFGASDNSASEWVANPTYSTFGIDHGYNVTISNNLITGWTEDAIDISNCSRIIVEDNEMHTPKQINYVLGSIGNAKGMKAGGDYTRGHIIRRNKIYNTRNKLYNPASGVPGTGISAEHGTNLYIYANELTQLEGYGIVRTAESDYNNDEPNFFDYNTISSDLDGIRVHSQSGMSDTYARNNILLGDGDIRILAGDATLGGNFIEGTITVSATQTTSSANYENQDSTDMYDGSYIPKASSIYLNLAELVGVDDNNQTIDSLDLLKLSRRGTPDFGAYEHAEILAPTIDQTYTAEKTDTSVIMKADISSNSTAVDSILIAYGLDRLSLDFNNIPMAPSQIAAGVTGITTANYSITSGLVASTKYYFEVTIVSDSGTVVEADSFTTLSTLTDDIFGDGDSTFVSILANYNAEDGLTSINSLGMEGSDSIVTAASSNLGAFAEGSFCFQMGVNATNEGMFYSAVNYDITKQYKIDIFFKVISGTWDIYEAYTSRDLGMDEANKTTITVGGPTHIVPIPIANPEGTGTQRVYVISSGGGGEIYWEFYTRELVSVP